MKQILFAVLLLSPALAHAQLGSGRLAGTIRDERGKAIKGATVTAENETYFPKSLTSATDAKGRFSILGLRNATYKIAIRAEGFDDVTLEMRIRMAQANPPLDLRLARKLAPGPPPLLANADAGRLQSEIDAAAALAGAGKTDAAIAAYRKILTNTPALSSINLQIGYLYELQGDRVAALSAYGAMLKADPSNAAARAALDRLRGSNR